MPIFGSGMSTGASARDATHEAVAQALRTFDRAPPKLALLFASVSYADLAVAPRALRDVVGNVPIIGGTSGPCVLGPSGTVARGASVVLLGGDDLEVAYRTARLDAPHHVAVVPAAREIARAADEAARRGLVHHVCLVFAPGIHVDGDALVAAVRKGAGARAQLAGGLTGDDLTMDRPQVFVRDELRSDTALLAGIFTRKHVGIAARHGFKATGPTRTVTRAEGAVLFELDHRRAIDVWLEDARRVGSVPPTDRCELASYLASHFELGIADEVTNEGGELVARAPWRVSEDGSLTLSGSIGEGRRVRLVHANRSDLLRASTNAAAEAVMRAGGRVVGALVLPCAGRVVSLGHQFAEETARIRERIAAPIGGSTVFGEIAKNERDVDAFFNTTTTIVAFGA